MVKISWPFDHGGFSISTIDDNRTYAVWSCFIEITCFIETRIAPALLGLRQALKISIYDSILA